MSIWRRSYPDGGFGEGEVLYELELAELTLGSDSFAVIGGSGFDGQP